MRRAAILITTLVAALMLASGIAYAKSFVGTSQNDTINGTSQNDTISGGGKDDTLNGKGGDDRVNGNSGADDVSGGAGNDDVFGGKGADNLNGNGGDDYMNSADNRGGDVVDCGAGFDSAVIDAVGFDGEAAIGTAGLPAQPQDTTTDCEDVTTVITNPGTGTGSGDDLPRLSSMSLEEVEAAIADGTLIEVE